MRQAISELTGVPAAQVRVSATRTPTPAPRWGRQVEEGAELVAPYTASLPGRVAGVAWVAWRGWCRCGGGDGGAGSGVNRRVQAPDGRTVVGRNLPGSSTSGACPASGRRPRGRLCRTCRGGAPVALLHYATHPTLMAHENRLITPDYPGWPGARWRPSRGPRGSSCRGAPETSARRGDHRGPHRGYQLLPPGGEDPGGGGGAGLSDPGDAPSRRHLRGGSGVRGPLGVYRHAPLPSRSARRPARCAWRRRRPSSRCARFPLTRKGRARAAEAREALATLRREGAPAQVAEATWRAKRIAQQAGHSRLTDGRPTVEVELQAIRVGQAALLGAPMEVFNALGASVAEGSPFPWTAVSGYSNGSTGYLLTAEAFGARGLRGGDGQPLRPGGRGALRGARAICCGACADRLLRGPSVEGAGRAPTCHLRYLGPPPSAAPPASGAAPPGR